MTAAPKRKAQPEAIIQRAIIARLRMSGIVCHHSPNAAKRSVIGGRRIKADGMITGWPDLTVVGQEGLVAFLEVKAPDGKPSPAQRKQQNNVVQTRSKSNKGGAVTSPPGMLSGGVAAR